jgi:hypothetical protein
LSGIGSKRIARQEQHRDDFSRKCVGGNPKCSVNWREAKVISVPELLEVVGEAPVQFRGIVSKLVELLVGLRAVQREHEAFSRQEDEEARSERGHERSQREPEQHDRSPSLERRAAQERYDERRRPEEDPGPGTQLLEHLLLFVERPDGRLVCNSFEVTHSSCVVPADRASPHRPSRRDQARGAELVDEAVAGVVVAAVLTEEALV